MASANDVLTRTRGTPRSSRASQYSTARRHRTRPGGKEKMAAIVAKLVVRKATETARRSSQVRSSAGAVAELDHRNLSQSGNTEFRPPLQATRTHAPISGQEKARFFRNGTMPMWKVLALREPLDQFADWEASLAVGTCERCQRFRIEPASELRRKLCSACVADSGSVPLFSAENDTDPGEIPAHLTGDMWPTDVCSLQATFYCFLFC